MHDLNNYLAPWDLGKLTQMEKKKEKHLLLPLLSLKTV